LLKNFFSAALPLILLMAAVGCQKTENQGDLAGTMAAAASETKAELPPGAIGGQVIETMDSGGYTYVLVDTGSESIWAAGPETEVAVGQQVVMTKSMVMVDFHSKTLDRTFAKIHFVGSIEVDDHVHSTEETAASPHGMSAESTMATMGGSHTQLTKTAVEPVEKAEGGFTVAEIYAQKAELADQPVAVRGQVVKFTPNIMGTNWVHLQDGTGDEQTCDLTVTTDARPEVGDLVTVSGPLTVDKDFGAGYFYGVIIENASLKKE
jgi:hypothetical protein